MRQAEFNTAQVEFEKLLAATWAAQLAQLRSGANSCHPPAMPDSQESGDRQGEARWTPTVK